MDLVTLVTGFLAGATTVILLWQRWLRRRADPPR